MPTQEATEDIHTPNPLPARGIYGFSLYISSFCALILYTLWAVVPSPLLNKAAGSSFPKMRSPFVVQCIARRLRHRTMKIPSAVPEKSVSRGSQVELIHKRLAAFEREQKENVIKKSNFATNSIAAENLIKTDSSYAKVLQRRLLEVEEVQKTPEINSTDHYMPLAFKPINDDIAQVNNSDNAEFPGGAACDRGYFVEGNEYVDDYVLGTAADIPDEVTTRSYDYFGSDDVAEVIDFQHPGQSTQGQEQLGQSFDDGVREESEELEPNTGAENQYKTRINAKCSGCGAQMHCENSSVPGFISEEEITKYSGKRLPDNILCRRCHLLKQYHFLLNVNVCEVDYASIMSCLRMNEEALVLLVVDITDIPGSIHHQLPHIIGSSKPMIVIANKVDLLPPDARTGYLKRFKNVVEETIEAAGFRKHFTILHTALVSAKTGYGVEDLVTEIYLKYTSVRLDVRNDIYLIGCTNAGKSSLFNALLQSDLCKVRALDLVERATTSIWPGTTVSSNNFYFYLFFLFLFFFCFSTKKDDEMEPTTLDMTEDGSAVEKSSRRWSLKDPVFSKGMWCYDTPGTINDQQVLNLFTLEELIHVLPRRLLQPRTALVPVGHSLIIGGLARLDVMECARGDAVLLTTFASDDLPINSMPTVEADTFLRENTGSEALVVPKGGARLSEWPKLESRIFELKGNKEGTGVADIVLSSIGWVLLSTSSPLVRLRCFTPGGKGLTTRTPMLPYAATLRGKRIPGTRFYKVKPIEFPVNIRRIKALKRRRRFSKD
ncbi:hypothetical protein NECAME_12699 [Necator americanus]|uniref:G domain-containing protein n=1 Tax=Necator americanus TaxID=51031 RepID=W2SZX9_NECAM|nr:hypothetical protein NECAME_12699 [Necator americanus]ETN74859.1 hypothetical protein NECAME_12699 [Necator americanus]